MTGGFPLLTYDEYEEKRVQWENATPGSLPGEYCPACLNKGYIRERQDGRTISVECRCMAKRKSLRRIQKSGLGDMLERYTFQAYQTLDKWQQEAKKRALSYLSDHEGKWFVAAGAVGSGKSHLCTAICGELMNAGMEVRYMLWRDEVRRIKALANDSEYNKLVGPLKSVPVLYIDDFFKAKDGEVSAGDVHVAFELLNTRYNRKDLVTIISTELTIDQILNIDQAVGSRIYERSKDYCLRIVGADKNWRLRH